MKARVLIGDCRDVLRELAPESVHAVVTDPPYELGFMGKVWDGTGIAFGPDFWRECLRVLKPGGHLLAFGGTRTFHRQMVAIEDAGFKIRDCLVWMYGSGFPKSKNLTGEWDGWGTALKPAFEPIVLARKPLSERNIAANVLEHGTGALNIDGCRIGSEVLPARRRRISLIGTFEGADGNVTPEREGRWPANVVLDEAAAALLDEQSGELVSGANPTRRGSDNLRGVYGDFKGQPECEAPRGVDRGASRFFYVAKPDRAERDAGLEHVEHRTRNRVNPGGLEHDPKWAPVTVKNHHPTVKPVLLMSWLVRLVCPPGGTVLDPFTGSGTTGMACALEQFDFIGIEQSAEYAEIAEARIKNAAPLFVDIALEDRRALKETAVRRY